MKKQLFAATIVFRLLCTVFAFRASASDITGVFQFESTPSDSIDAARLAGSFSISVDEHYRDFGPTAPRFSKWTIDNHSDFATIVGVYVYDPTHIAPLFTREGSFFVDYSLYPVGTFPPVPQDILDFFSPTPGGSWFAAPGSVPYGVPPGGFFGFFEDTPPPGLVDAFDNGSVRVGILVTGFKGDETATFVSVPDASWTAILLLASLFSVEVARRRCRE